MSDDNVLATKILELESRIDNLETIVKGLAVVNALIGQTDDKEQPADANLDIVSVDLKVVDEDPEHGATIAWKVQLKNHDPQGYNGFLRIELKDESGFTVKSYLREFAIRETQEVALSDEEYLSSDIFGQIDTISAGFNSIFVG